MEFESDGLMNRFFMFIKRLALLFNEKIITPIKNTFAAIIRFIKNITIFKSAPPSEEVAAQEPLTEVQWKVKALEDFQLWLSQIPSEEPPAMTATPDTCDLYTMLSEFTSLRQEIRAQNREQHRTVDALNSVKGVTDEYGEIYTLFKEKTNQIAQLEQNIRLNSEKKATISFFDVRDSLVSGYKSSVEMASRKGFFRRPPKDIHTICQGYEMAISRFDNALSTMNIEPVQTDNNPFNPETMKIVESREVSDIENGMVIETVSAGFVRGGEVLRFAKVVVAQNTNVL